MTRGRLHTLGASLPLTVLGAAAVAMTLPRLALASNLPSCISESSGTAWLGIHLRLLSPSAACPDGSFAPGAGYAEIASFSIILSLSALITGLVALLGTVGFGMAARHAAHRARDWVRRQLQPIVVVALRRPSGARPPLTALVAVFLNQHWASSQLRRGPPARLAA